VRTLGVDLASQPANTALCIVDWPSRAIVELAVGVDDEAILAHLRTGLPAGIDAPFGWPQRFVAALAEWNETGRWGEPWREHARELRLRETDRWVAEHVGKWPLSVSADSIATCAMRAATLLSALGPVDRVNGPCYEVYPGAALRVWGLPSAGYKRDPTVRARLAAALGFDDERLAAGDHALDALLCALVARAAALGLTHPPPVSELVAREGWIHVPAVGISDI
jgi:hypothetical protein